MSKCELFDFLDSCDFFTKKSLLISHIGAEIKNRNFYGLVPIIAVLLAKNLVSVCAGYAYMIFDFELE
jgi:hypothetical protein